MSDRINDSGVTKTKCIRCQSAIEELKAARETLLLYASGTPWIDNVGGERYAASERVERIDKFLKEIE